MCGAVTALREVSPAHGGRLRVLSTDQGETRQARDESLLVAALRSGDESAFLGLVERYHASMIRMARSYVSSDAVAEEVAQEAWIGILKGIHLFEGRSSLKVWIFKIVANCAKNRSAREGRAVPFSSIHEPDGAREPSVDPERFLELDHPRWPGHWASPPEAWGEERVISNETLERVRQAIDELPDMQRRVIVMRDVEGCDSDETCELLGISEGNQRVLLHRARAKVRAALEQYMKGAGD